MHIGSANTQDLQDRARRFRRGAKEDPGGVFPLAKELSKSNPAKDSP